MITIDTFILAYYYYYYYYYYICLIIRKRSVGSMIIYGYSKRALQFRQYKIQNWNIRCLISKRRLKDIFTRNVKMKSKRLLKTFKISLTEDKGMAMAMSSTYLT